MEHQQTKVIPWSWTSEPDEDSFRKKLEGEGYQVFKWADSPGTHYPPHQHTCDESIWVLEGEIEFKVGEKNFILKSGDRLLLPSGTSHAAKVPESSKCFYLVGQKN